MSEERKSICSLDGNMLKIIAAVCMLIDHIGVRIFPEAIILRIIGRMSFPIFAFMIAEGCRYTKNKLRYFLSVFLLGAACQIVYYLYDESLDMCILITFSLSILIIYAMQRFKNAIFSPESTPLEKILSGALFLTSIALAFVLNKCFSIDYGFVGCMLPVFAALFHQPSKNASKLLQRLDHRYIHIAMMGVALLVYSLRSSWVQMFSLLAIPLLLLYSGKRGKGNTKYLFYIFYPAHLAILEAIAVLL